MSDWRKIEIIITALFCLAIGRVSSATLQEQAAQTSRQFSSPAPKSRTAVALSESQTASPRQSGLDVLNPMDALDEAKAGVAASFVPVEAGEFDMGSPDDESSRWGWDDETRHSVKLTKGFEMQATEVTQLQYVLVMSTNPSWFKEKKYCDAQNYRVLAGIPLCASHPVETVTWDDVQAFIGRLNEFQDKYTYRLPTEAEWEYASRTGTSSPYSFGDNKSNELDSYAWYYGNSKGRTHAVASRKANAWHLYDMYGNVAEWVQDFYGAYPAEAVTDPKGPEGGAHRVFRGGSWFNFAGQLRSAFRNGALPEDVSTVTLGFRLVRSSRQEP